MADIRGFTTLSEGLAPKELTTLLNLYLGALTDIILDHGGTLDKYMGDAVMAFFGAPVAHPEDPVTACRAAVSMCEALHEKRLEWEAQGLPKLHIGVGVNTGPMVVGNLGSARRFDYSVIGDHVNLASRLEGLSKVYGVKIIISEYHHKNETRIGYRWESLAYPMVGKQMEPFVVEIEPREEQQLLFNDHKGEEFHFILDGIVEFRSADQVHHLKKGDSLYFDSSIPHALRGIGGVAKSLIVIFAPK